MIERQYYNTTTLEKTLAVYEAHFGLSSDAFYEAYREGETMGGLSSYQAHMWASFYREYHRLTGDMARRIERELELA